MGMSCNGCYIGILGITQKVPSQRGVSCNATGLVDSRATDVPRRGARVVIENISNYTTTRMEMSFVKGREL
mgnify:CR=1 FL=1